MVMKVIIENLHNFLIEYFEANQCEVIADTDSLNIKLTEEMDELLMNRPFYWHYVRKLNQKGHPLELKLTTNYLKATKDIDYLYFSTDRFWKIAQDTLSKGRFTKLYQKIDIREQTPIYPWLIINFKLIYLGKKQSEELKSYGIHLINGTIIDEAFEWLQEKQWTLTIPDFCYPISPIIKPENGYTRIEQYILNDLQSKQHDWASESYQSLTEEIQVLDYFKHNSPNMDPKHYQQEKANLESIYQPKIKIEVINGGLFYIQQ
ncbi:YqhG family protein [Amphibacillus sp. MSJ-3]|uniref:YqhG family protein n=1 Tax=Amphibacillus sp. MSJ-3 TaxID=2841505 RepID=UPI00352FFC3C